MYVGTEYSFTDLKVTGRRLPCPLNENGHHQWEARRWNLLQIAVVKRSPQALSQVDEEYNFRGHCIFPEIQLRMVVNGVTRFGGHVGYIGNNWNMDKFQDYEGSVTLSNDWTNSTRIVPAF